jgi:orotidine-5'-phosphate decarboxylase
LELVLSNKKIWKKQEVKKMNAIDRLILALDVRNLQEASLVLNKLEGNLGMVKVNSLFVEEPSIISIIQSRKMKVFLDLKHHDIPGTVKNFIMADVRKGVQMTTIHCLGGNKMMQYAAEGAQGSDLNVLGITILTSHNSESFNEEIGIPGLITDKVLDLAGRAEESGLQGIVASAQELGMLRENLEPETLIVTPGINPEWAKKRDDQKRVTTPYEAIRNGANYIVVGSAIIESEKKHGKTIEEAANLILAEIDKALTDRNF